MKWLIYKRTFHSAHHLPCHKGKCRNIHGHTYRLEIALRPKQGSVMNGWKGCESMVMDFGEMRATINRRLDDYDHANLNEFIPEPTVEAFAMEIWKAVADVGFQVRYIKLYETDSCGVFIETTDRLEGGGRG